MGKRDKDQGGNAHNSNTIRKFTSKLVNKFDHHNYYKKTRNRNLIPTGNSAVHAEGSCNY